MINKENDHLQQTIQDIQDKASKMHLDLESSNKEN